MHNHQHCSFPAATRNFTKSPCIIRVCYASCTSRRTQVEAIGVDIVSADTCRPHSHSKGVKPHVYTRPFTDACCPQSHSKRVTPLRVRHADSQGLVCLEPVVVDDVLPSLSHCLHLPQCARLAPLQVLRVHRDDVAPLVLLSRHQQLHCRLQAKRPRTV